MAKRNEIDYRKARNLYVNEMKSYKEIAENLGYTERTIQRWALDNKWENDKNEYLAGLRELRNGTQEIALLMMENIKKTLAEGKEPNSHTLNAYTRITGNLLKINDYESKEKASNTNDEENDSEAVRKQFETTFGVSLDPKP